VLELPANIDTWTADLTDDDALLLARAILAEQLAERWAEHAATFPLRGDPDEAWPPDYESVRAWREIQREALNDPLLAAGAKGYYADHIAEFISHWCITYDPRHSGRRGEDGRPLGTKMPFILFKRQREFVDFLLACLNGAESGLAEKCRDMGATWVACGFSVALWLFWPGAAVGWGSRKEVLVDQIGDPKCVFEKMRMIVRELPAPLLPAGFGEADDMTFMKFVNRETDATITGEAGDNIGRGGRTLIYFKDESAHYERPEKIEASLGDNTNVQIDISSVNGLGNVFHRRREAGVDWTPGKPIEPGRTAVFVMDWRDHPEKDEAWYARRKQKATDDGLLHVFRQEVDRDYAAAIEGTIIPAEWIRSAIDAHIKLKWPVSRRWSLALDVADGGLDKNAIAGVLGSVIALAETWTERDTGVTTRRAITACTGKGWVDLQYDCIGVGAGVKAEANRLDEEGELPGSIHLTPWNAGANPLDADEPVVPDDMDSPLNGDFFENLKAQAWWRVRIRFEKTHRAVTEGIYYPPDELVSIDSTLPMLRQIEKELSQPVKKPGALKIIVNKTPEGTRSPNVGDAIIMALNPVPGMRPVFSTTPNDLAIEPFAIPGHWRRAFAMKETEDHRIAVLWCAWDKATDTLYLTSEHSHGHAEPASTAAAINARGRWIPGILDAMAVNKLEMRHELSLWMTLGVKVVDIADRAIEAGITDMASRAATGRLRIFASCRETLKAYRSYRRGEDGKPVGTGLIDCARVLCRSSSLARTVPVPQPLVRQFGNTDTSAQRVGDPKAGY
jgi:phage terminase large subunit